MIETRDFAGIEAGMLKKMAEIEQHGSFVRRIHMFVRFCFSAVD
jgi:hypothetical protein